MGGWGDLPWGDFPWGDSILSASPDVIQKYLKLLTSQYKTKPRFNAWLASVLQFAGDAQNVINTIDGHFNVDTAVGPQLDVLGTLVGVSRFVPFQPTGVAAPSGSFDMLQWLVPSPSIRNSFHYEGVSPLKTINVSSSAGSPSVSVSGNILTLRGNNSCKIGDFTKLSGFLGGDSFLNGQTITVTNSILGPTGTLVGSFIHSNYSSNGSGYGISASNHHYIAVYANYYYYVKGKGGNPPGAGGFPWDIQYFDNTGDLANDKIYLSTTELNFSQANSGKRHESLNPAIGLRGLPLAKRLGTPGDSLLSPEPVRGVIYTNGIQTSTYILGHTKAELKGPFVETFGNPGASTGANLPPNLITLHIEYNWGGTDPSPIYNNLETYTLGYDQPTDTYYGMIHWKHQDGDGSGGFLPPDLESLFNKLVPGTSGLPPYDPFPFGSQVGSPPPPIVQGVGSVISAPVLDDPTFRTYIRAKIGQNHWDGRMSSLQSLWKSLFPGGQITIQDNQNMTMNVFLAGTFTQIAKDLINNGLIIPRPQAVLLNTTFATQPLLGFDQDNEFVAGFDKGHAA